MRRNPERSAWAVLLTAFAVFCLIIVAVPLSVRWYLIHAQDAPDVMVESLAGTVVIEPAVGQGPVPLGKGETQTASEGTTIRVDEMAGAAITFYDHTWMRLFPGTTLRLNRVRTPRFKSSPISNTVRIDLSGGQILVGTALSLDSPLDFSVSTLQGTTTLRADGSYSIEANNERTEIITHRGIALAQASGTRVMVEMGQRTQIALNQPPQPATGAARNLVINGDFDEALDVGWRVFNEQGSDGGAVDGRAELVVDEGQSAVRLSRTGGQADHCETILEQVIDRQLSDPISRLVLRATAKVRYQSLSGGGYLSSEYPLMIRLTYRDVYDSEAEWVQGFYYQNVHNNPTMYGLQIPRDRWHVYESENLLESLPIRPYKIIKLRVYAAGWDYESLLSDISLIVE